MPSRNPYQMDPMLAQGFSSLTKALIGDPETDYQVARTNRVNELLPLEKQQMQAQIGGSNASAAAARALETLRQSQTLTEDQLRNPRVQTELANAKAVLALAGERDAKAAFTGSQTATEEALRGPRVASEEQLAAERAAQAQSRIASAMFTGAQTNTEDALRGPRVASEEQLAAERTAQAQNRIASAMLAGAQTNTEEALLTPRVDQTNAEGAAANALARERDAAAALSKAKTDSEGQIILNAGQTIRTTNADGEVETYTAPRTTEVTVEAGEVAVIVNPDGTQTRIEGPTGTGDPKDAAERLKTIDAQLQEFFGADDFSEVPKSLLRRIRSNTTNAAKDRDIEEVSAQLQALLSQTFRGNSVFTVTTGSNFSVPAFIANAARDSRMTESKVVELYGLSADHARRLLKDVRAQ
mgnify:CR=1 FL=1